MPKLICEYCKYGNLEKQECAIGGWSRCEGDLFIDKRISEDAANFARFIDEKTGHDNTMLLINDNTEITYEQLYDIYDTRRNVLESTINFQKKPFKVHRNKHNIVIKVGYGDYERKSLGDFLVYSKLPRLLKESGYKAVYLSSYTPFRNKGIEDLIMLNPYIDGVVDIKPMDNINIDFLFRNNMDNQRNIMGLIHEAYGVANDEVLAPDIYYKPRLIKSLVGTTIFNPNSNTTNCGVTSENALQWFKDNNIKVDFQIQTREKFTATLPSVPIIEVKDIFNWIDVMTSASNTYSLFTGDNVLMSGYAKNHNCLYSSKHKDPCFDFWLFDIVNYIDICKAD